MPSRFWNRRRRRHLLVPVVAAVLGGIVVLLFERSLFRPKPVPLPVLATQTASAPPTHGMAPKELEQRIRVNPCVDLHTYVCALARAEDPTGEVRRDAEGEVDVLRIYESIIRKSPRMSASKIDELLVRKVYTLDRIRRIRGLFNRTKSHLLKFIDSQPFQALSQSDKEVLRARVERVRLELPPPASVYADEPGLFTRNDVYYERTTDGQARIRIGGALLFTVRSQFNLAFTLAHELAHSVDPCELLSAKVDILSYQGLAQCFGSPPEAIAGECGAKGKLSEIFADWVATHVVADLLAESAASFTPSQVRSAVYSTVRDLCRETPELDDDDDDDDFEEAGSGLAASHPSVSFRVNRIFAQHPMIRRFLSCKDLSGPTLPGVPPYCFWPAGKSPKTRTGRDASN